MTASRLAAEPDHARRTAAAMIRAVADALTACGVETVTVADLHAYADEMEAA